MLGHVVVLHFSLLWPKLALQQQTLFFFSHLHLRASVNRVTKHAHITQTHQPQMTNHSVSPSQIEKNLCFASAEFEDFVLQFLDR